MNNSAAPAYPPDRKTETPPVTALSAQQIVGARSSASTPDADWIGSLCSHAFKEAENWKSCKAVRRCSFLRRRWQQASRSIQKTFRQLSVLTSGKKKLSPESLWLLENTRLLQTALSDTRQTKDVKRLPLIASDTGEHMPRAYAIAKSYLQTVDFRFGIDSLSTYLEAVDQSVGLHMDELHAIRPMLQLSLLEQITTISEGLRYQLKNQQSFSNDDADLATCINSLRQIGEEDWKDLFEKVSRVEQILQEDPAGAYPDMDFESRNLYLMRVADLAAYSGVEESEIARRAIALASRVSQSHCNQRVTERRSHVGYYLIENGKRLLEKEINYNPPPFKVLQSLILAHPVAFYLGGILFTAAVVITFLLNVLGVQAAFLAALAFLLLPATECGVAIMNELTTFLVGPRLLPKLDFSEGIPTECTTMVVVPTLLLSEEHTRQMVQDLEIRYLANRDANLHFALLTDSPDSSRPFDERDQWVGLCSQLVQDLNEKYARHGKRSFFLFHRHRVYNPAEDRWMGWERKRGKLLDLNNLLRGGFDSFPVKIGDLSILPRVRYVITLDSDTQLPKDSARKLVGTLAHPVNRAVIDPLTNTVVEGYSILQPRVGINVKSVGRSRLASLCSGEAGLDIYARAISDVYQDLFGEGSFTGKGIYEVDSFQQVLGGRFPCNALLSHDLIEGSYARAALVSDIELIDDYPSHFSAYSRRKHRWVRGDWQIVLWLLPKVLDYFGKLIPNPLTLISRWKILDNLRRSLIEIATLCLLLAGWFCLPGKPMYWTMATLVLMLTPTYFQFFLSLLRSARARNLLGFWKQMAATFVDRQVNVFLMLAFLSHQTLVMLDAIVRTIVRLTLTRKKLLEWETAAQSELGVDKRNPVDVYLDWTPWLSLGIGSTLALVRPEALPAAVPLLTLWSVSKPLCRWLNRPAYEPQPVIVKGDELFLRSVGLRTWRYFREFSNTETKWLIPDNIQEAPFTVTARLSPTNLGLLLNARTAAYELGYLTPKEYIQETTKSLSSARELPKYKGHFFNWYDIRTLKPVEPFFISTVDSGNLAGCLWTLKQACLEMRRHPLLRPQLWQGIRDHLNLIGELAEQEQRHPALAESIRALGARFELLSEDASLWPSLWPQAEQQAFRLVSDFLNGPSEGQEELRWWAEQVLRQLQAAREIVEHFAPWLLPEHDNILSRSGFQLPGSVDNLTLESLPPFLRKLDGHLEELLRREGTESQIKCAVESLRARLPICLHNAETTLESLQQLAAEAETLVEEMDFRFLYNARKKLLSVGYDVSNQSLTQGCYDLLASESRMAAFIAVAKGDVPQDSWFHLGRTHTSQKGKRVLLSWAGSMFEYLMPSLWMKCYPNTILEQSLRAVVRCQQEYGKRNQIPWGISEAACSDRDDKGYYQYGAFGLPNLALKQAHLTDIVVSPYAAALALTIDPLGVISNLRLMAEMQWLDKLGFFESADYTKTRIGPQQSYEVIRCWMAHHQGMTLSAICNFLTDASLQQFFHSEPQVAANERILHERVPKSVSVDKGDEPRLPVETPEQIIAGTRLNGTAIGAFSRLRSGQVEFVTREDESACFTP
jgi:cyclic beta-1,2-glucan synthetase